MQCSPVITGDHAFSYQTVPDYSNRTVIDRTVLNGFTIYLPPLRERGDDLNLLVERFRRQANRDLNKNVREVSPEALNVLRQYSWPGNVRELQNVIRQAILKTTGPVLMPDFLPEFVGRKNGEASDARRNLSSDRNGNLDSLIDERLEANSPQLYDDIIGHVEQRLVSKALERAGGDKAEAARLLGVNPALLRSKASLELLDLDAIAVAINGDRQAGPLIRPGMTMAEIEKEAIRRTLSRTKGCRKEAARLLGMSTRTMQRRVKELELD